MTLRPLAPALLPLLLLSGPWAVRGAHPGGDPKGASCTVGP